jgi:5,10-methylenetetrahydrofolate reductase
MIENLVDKLQNSDYLSVEITPKKSARFEPPLKKDRHTTILKKSDAFSLTDNPLAKLKYSSMLAGIKVQEEYGKPSIVTLSMRDKNLLALQSEILGGNDFGVRLFLTLTGDPAKLSDHPHLKGVFEGDSSLLLQIIRHLNLRVDYSGREISGDIDKIYAFSVTNSYAKNFNNIKKKIAKKIENGSSGIITQPLFHLDNAKKLLEIQKDIKSSFSDTRGKSELVLGFFPMTKLKTAQFLSAHVPGIYVPNELLDLLVAAAKIGEEEEYKVGLEYSKKLYSKLHSLHPKIHIMSANRFDVIEEILS